MHFHGSGSVAPCTHGHQRKAKKRFSFGCEKKLLPFRNRVPWNVGLILVGRERNSSILCAGGFFQNTLDSIIFLRNSLSSRLSAVSVVCARVLLSMSFSSSIPVLWGPLCVDDILLLLAFSAVFFPPLASRNPKQFLEIFRYTTHAPSHMRFRAKEIRLWTISRRLTAEILWKVHIIEIKFRIKRRSRKRSPLERNIKDFSETTTSHFRSLARWKPQSEERKSKGVDLFEKVSARRRRKS